MDFQDRRAQLAASEQSNPVAPAVCAPPSTDDPSMLQSVAPDSNGGAVSPTSPFAGQLSGYFGSMGGADRGAASADPGAPPAQHDGWFSNALHRAVALGSSAVDAVESGANAVSRGVDFAEGKVRSGMHTAEDWVDAGTHSIADRVGDVPVLGAVAHSAADGLTAGAQLVGGVAEGATDFVGGLVNTVAHPINIAKRIEALGEHAGIPGVSTALRAGHDLIDGRSVSDTANRALNPLEDSTRKEDSQFWHQAWNGIKEPYAKSVDDGRPMEAVGHGVFDVASMLVGAGEAGDAARVGEVASDAERASKIADVAQVANDAEHASSVVKAGELGDDVERASDAARAASDATNVTRDVEKAQTVSTVGPGAALADETGVDASFESGQVHSGTMFQFSDEHGPLSGSGPRAGGPDSAISYHDNIKIPGAGPDGEAVNLRTHSPNPNAPEGSYSRSNYTTQINTAKNPKLYRSPDGTWKSLNDMSDSEIEAAHYPAGG